MFFWPKTDVPENNSGRECCWPYLIGQHSLSRVFGQKRPGTPGISYFAQLPPVFGHFMFRFWPFYVPFLANLCSFPVGYSTTRTNQHGPQEQLTPKVWSGEVEILSFSVNNFGGNQYVCLGDTLKALLHQPEPQQEPTVRCRQGDA